MASPFPPPHGSSSAFANARTRAYFGHERRPSIVHSTALEQTAPAAMAHRNNSSRADATARRLEFVEVPHEGEKDADGGEAPPMGNGELDFLTPVMVSSSQMQVQQTTGGAAAVATPERRQPPRQQAQPSPWRVEQMTEADRVALEAFERSQRQEQQPHQVPQQDMPRTPPRGLAVPDAAPAPATITAGAGPSTPSPLHPAAIIVKEFKERQRARVRAMLASVERAHVEVTEDGARVEAMLEHARKEVQGEVARVEALLAHAREQADQS